MFETDIVSRFEERCPYCDTEFVVEFDNTDDEVMFCPCCGEQLPEFDEEELDFNEDDEWE